MKRSLVVLACIVLLLAGASASVVGAQTTDSGQSAAGAADGAYSLETSGTVPVHDRRATVGDAEVNVTSLVGLYPGEEALVNVTAPEDELAVVTLRRADGSVLQKDSVTAGESVLVDSTDYDPGTYYLVLTTGGEVRTVSLLVVSKYRVSYDLENVTGEAVSGGATVSAGTAEGETVQFVLTNEDAEYRVDASTVRRGLYNFSLATDDVPDGEYSALIEVVGEADATGSRPVLATSQIETVTVGAADAESGAEAASDADESSAATDDAGDSTAVPAEAGTGTEAVESGSGKAAETRSNSTVPDLGPVALFALLVSWAVVARVRRRA